VDALKCKQCGGIIKDHHCIYCKTPYKVVSFVEFKPYKFIIILFIFMLLNLNIGINYNNEIESNITIKEENKIIILNKTIKENKVIINPLLKPPFDYSKINKIKELTKIV